MTNDDLTIIKPVKTALTMRSLSTGETFPLNGEILIGREVECDVRLNSPVISRYHAKITLAANGAYIEDLHSSNGTFVNGHKVTARVRLALGDEVSFENIAFRITSHSSGQEDATRVMGVVPQTGGPQSQRPISQGAAHQKATPQGTAPQGKTPQTSAPAGHASRPDIDQSRKILQERVTNSMSARPQVQAPPKTRVAPAPGHTPKPEDARPAERQHSAPQNPESQNPKLQIPKPRIREPQNVAHENHAPITPENPPQVSEPKTAAENKTTSARQPTPIASPKAREIRGESLPQSETPIQRSRDIEETLEQQAAQAKPAMRSAIETQKEQLQQEQERETHKQALAKKEALEEQAEKDRLKNDLKSILAQKNADGTTTELVNPDQLARIAERNQQLKRDLQVGTGPRLVIMSAPTRGKIFPLKIHDASLEWRIGRDPEADIHIAEQAISFDHARITLEEDGFVIANTHATNGMLINGVFKNRVLLSHNDTIQIGRMELVFKTDHWEPPATDTPEKTPLANKNAMKLGSWVGAAIVITAIIIAAVRGG